MSIRFGYRLQSGIGRGILKVRTYRYSTTATMQYVSGLSKYEGWSREELIKRIHELEHENISHSPSATNAMTNSSTNIEEMEPVKKKKKELDFSKFATRKIALRFAYLGWHYNGLAVQTNTDVPTVENEILVALHRTKLIHSMDVSDCEFSRCGRTDKGVSAFRQAISLNVRSALTTEEQQDRANDRKELDYLHILNNLLPSDIRMYEVCLHPPPNFDARFSCLSRHYKYYFFNDKSNSLDLQLMSQGASYFLGEHDFRNFCKVDPSKQITNFKRTIMKAEIVQDSSGMCHFDLKGTAFLWHQVRSMIAVLFLVAQKLESPEIIKELLDIDKYPQRPVYEMAADFPLVLYDCEFPEMEWMSLRNGETMRRSNNQVFDLWYEQFIQSHVVTEMNKMITECSTAQIAPKEDRIYVNTGDGRGRGLAKYPQLAIRGRLDTPEVVNERYRMKLKNKEP